MTGVQNSIPAVLKFRTFWKGPQYQKDHITSRLPYPGDNDGVYLVETKKGSKQGSYDEKHSSDSMIRFIDDLIRQIQNQKPTVIYWATTISPVKMLWTGLRGRRQSTYETDWSGSPARNEGDGSTPGHQSRRGICHVVRRRVGQSLLEVSLGQMAAATANPVFEMEQKGELQAKIAYKQIDIEAGLKDGSLSSDEAIVLMERQIEAKVFTKIAQLEARLSGGAGDAGSSFESAVRGLVARLTETPTNFHQSTVFFLAAGAPEDAAMARRAPLLYAGSLAMVGLQSATAVGVFYGTTFPSCATSDQCGAGTFCEVGMGHRCEYCGNGGPVSGDDIGNLTFVAEVCALPYAERRRSDRGGLDFGQSLASTAVASWCEACVRNDGTIDPLTGDSLAAANVAAMGPFDDVALAFAAFIVAFTVVGELKDIELCSMAVAHAGDKLSKGWRLALGFLLWMRRWLFLPTLVLTAPMLVMFKGGDALSVCLNTVATLFLCDIDNIAFDLALGERVRARVEDAGRVELNDAEAPALARTKAVHVALLVLAVLGGAWTAGEGALFLPFLAFLLGGVTEAIVPGASAVETCKRVGKVLGAWLLGGVGFVVLFTIAKRKGKGID
eukprot:COSAG02_NODE_4662_length_5119_cov_2.425299_2_plen_612_part_00